VLMYPGIEYGVSRHRIYTSDRYKSVNVWIWINRHLFHAHLFMSADPFSWSIERKSVSVEICDDLDILKERG
jgi:hypothetical protein